MAEAAKKDSKGGRRYGSPPRVVDKGGAGASTTADKPVSSTPGAAPVATEASGTDGIPVTDRHAAERGEMATRHSDEMKDMHKRQAKDMAMMMERHMGEIGSGAITPGGNG